MLKFLRRVRKRFKTQSVDDSVQRRDMIAKTAEPSHCAATDRSRETNPKGKTYVDRLNTEIRARSTPLAESVLASDDPKLFFEEDEELAQLLWKDMFMPLCELIDLRPKARNQENFPGSEHCRCGKIP